MTLSDDPTTDLPTLLADYEWRSQFDAGTLHRALQYVDAGHVVELSCEPPDLTDPYHAARDSDDEDAGTLFGTITCCTHSPRWACNRRCPRSTSIAPGAAKATTTNACWIAYQTLTGQTAGSKRAALVQHFQDGNVPLFWRWRCRC